MVSPHVHVQFQIQVVGREDAVGVADEGVAMLPLCGPVLAFGVVVDASPDCGCACAPS